MVAKAHVFPRCRHAAAAFAAAFAAVLALCAVTPTAQAEIPTALAVEVAAEDGATRLRLVVDEPVEAASFVLDAPPRLVVDLPEVRWRLVPPAAAGLVAGLRFGLAAPGRARLVVDLAEPALAQRMRATPLQDGGFALDVDLVPVSAETFRAAAGWPEGEGPLRPRADAPVIVIDPGHGGRDPGAVVGGLLEKDITLRFSLALADALRDDGFAPVLTREDDRFISIAERIAIAREAGAAAFLSIHADTVPEASVSGASVYVLGREPTDRMAAALAAQAETGERLVLGAAEGGRDVAEALFALVSRETHGGSARLGSTLIEALADAVPVLRSNPLRAAAFRVLKAPDVPSALIELGFLSSATDRQRLTDPDWQQAAIRAIVTALERWAAAPRTAACAATACISPD